MQITIPRPLGATHVLMRRALYVPQRAGYHKVGTDTGYVRALTSGGFPRWHCYVEETGTTTTLKLHYDEKRETYGDDTAHHGVYEDPTLKAELDRLVKAFH